MMEFGDHQVTNIGPKLAAFIDEQVNKLFDLGKGLLEKGGDLISGIGSGGNSAPSSKSPKESGQSYMPPPAFKGKVGLSAEKAKVLGQQVSPQSIAIDKEKFAGLLSQANINSPMTVSTATGRAPAMSNAYGITFNPNDVYSANDLGNLQLQGIGQKQQSQGLQLTT